MRGRRWKAVLFGALVVGAGCFFTNEGADISLTGGNITLTIATASAGSQPDAATNSNCLLNWTTLIEDPTQKITVESSLSSPQFTLRVQATGVTGGTSAGQVVVGGSATDLVTDIPANTSDGQGTLAYQANSTAAQGTGSDSHTITYTITAQ